MGVGGDAAVSVSTTIPPLSSGLQRGHKPGQLPAPPPLEGAFIGSSLGFQWVNRINPAALRTPSSYHMWANLFWLHICCLTCRLLLCQMSAPVRTMSISRWPVSPNLEEKGGEIGLKTSIKLRKQQQAVAA